MHILSELLIIPHKSRLLQPTNNPIKPHNYNTLVWGENSHRPSPTNFASNNPINPYLLHPINPNRRYEFLNLYNQRRKYTPSNSLYAPYNSFRPRLPPQITPSGLVFWQGRVKMCSVLTLPITQKRMMIEMWRKWDEKRYYLSPFLTHKKYANKPMTAYSRCLCSR